MGLLGGHWALSGQQGDLLREVKVRVTWHFKKWQQELMLGIWSVSGLEN